MKRKVDVLIIGAGAAGLMCAIEAGKRGRSVLVIDHNNKVGKKILMSGGGYCNFTNYHIHPEKYLSHNPNFCKSALSRYTQWDFIALIEKHRVAYHEKGLGELFCDEKAQVIVDMLLKECQQAKAEIRLKTEIIDVEALSVGFIVSCKDVQIETESLVIATGGLSIPTMGATPFGYQLAEQFNLKVWPLRAGLVPFTWHQPDKELFESLSGVSVNSVVHNDAIQFHLDILFTHRGMSGPGMLQISSYWHPGETVNVNFFGQQDFLELFQTARQEHENIQVKTWLGQHLPKRMVQLFCPSEFAELPLKSIDHPKLKKLTHVFTEWQFKPNNTEGYRTAEVTLGGVDCDALSSKTFEVRTVKGLYFIGEVLDVTGWLGGYNFQWAWSSGWAAGQVV